MAGIRTFTGVRLGEGPSHLVWPLGMGCLEPSLGVTCSFHARANAHCEAPGGSLTQIGPGVPVQLAFGKVVAQANSQGEPRVVYFLARRPFMFASVAVVPRVLSLAGNSQAGT